MGVKVGEYTAISPETHFSSEPYLKTIGNHVQVAHAMSFYTHGGIVRRQIPGFDCFSFNSHLASKILSGKRWAIAIDPSYIT